MKLKYKWVGWGIGTNHSFENPPWMVWKANREGVLHTIQVDPREFWPGGFPPRMIPINIEASGYVR